jgi:hypothetical protein
MQIANISMSGLQKTPRDDAVEMIFNLCLVESKHVMYMHKFLLIPDAVHKKKHKISYKNLMTNNI